MAKKSKKVAKKAPAKKQAKKVVKAAKQTFLNVTKHKAVALSKKDITINVAPLIESAGGATTLKVSLGPKPKIEVLTAASGGKKGKNEEE